MKTIAKALVGVGLLTLSGIAALIVRSRKKDQVEPQNAEEKKPEKEESVIIFDLETREMKLVRLPQGKECEVGKERIGVVSMETSHSWQSLNAKKNAQLIRETKLTADEIRQIWLFAKETHSKSNEIYKYIQDTYLQETAEKVKEIIKEG